MMKTYNGIAAQKGFAAAMAYVLKPSPVTAARAESRTPAEELSALQAAADTLTTRLQAARENNAADIAEAELQLLHDASFLGAIRDKISTTECTALAAVEAVGRELADKLEDNASEYIRGRASDVRGLAEQLACLLNGDSRPALTHPCILLARELTPADLLSLDGERLMGIVTEIGSATSHVAVLAGNFGIPYVYGCAAAADAVTGDPVIVDTNVPENVVLCPDAETYRTAEARFAAESVARRQARESLPQTRVKVYANLSGPQNLPALLASAAGGVGLYRSEFLFVGSQSEPTEEEQYRAYRAVVEAMGDQETVIRTMDLGADKNVSWLKQPVEPNPALGCRGIRLSLRYPELLRRQLRALLRAAVHGNLKIMVPMVTAVWEVEKVKALAAQYADELTREGISCRVPPVGAMVETPAAVLIADELAQTAAFFSIGTNDLTQYTLALDREAQGLTDHYDPLHEAVFRLIGQTVQAAHRHGIPVSVCGELGAQAEAIPRLIAIGVDKLSVSIGKVDDVIRLAAEAEAALAPAQRTSDLPGLCSPCDGALLPMAAVPDPVFAAGTLGACLGFDTTDGLVYAPCDGIIESVAPTLHAVTVTAADGHSYLLHAGIDTVTLKGQGFTVHVQPGDRVTRGQLLLQEDISVIRAAGLKSVVVLVQVK